jgi:V/A-type H+-transporting ATPase subunit D
MSTPATRMTLLSSRDSLELAEKGVELLQSKREALLADLFKIADFTMDSREDIARDIQKAMIQAGLAKSFSGSHLIRAAAMSAKRDIPIQIRHSNVWGIRIPEIDFLSLRRTPEARGLLPIDTSPHILETAESYEKILEKLLRTANYELRLKRIGGELRKVSRRINALEQSIIPALGNRIKRITETLQEREREDLFRLKHLKNRKNRMT